MSCNRLEFGQPVRSVTNVAKVLGGIRRRGEQHRRVGDAGRGGGGGGELPEADPVFGGGRSGGGGVRDMGRSTVAVFLVRSIGESHFSFE